MFTNSFYPNFYRALRNIRNTILALIAAPIFVCASSDIRAEPAQTETAILAGGCFWCIESDFETIKGVTDVISGYTGGKTFSPTYEEVSFGGSGHIEAVKISFDPKIISYDKILDLFWRSVNPTDRGGQFCDRGHHYSTAIFYSSEDQKKTATISKAMLQEKNILGKKIVTPILKASRFWPAETYHQDYYKKNPIRYKFYRKSCGRDRVVKKLWGDQAWTTKKH